MSKSGSRATRRTFGLLTAPALGLGLFLFLSASLGQTAAQRAPESLDLTVGHRVVSTATGPLMPDLRIAALMDRITTDTVAAYERALTGEEAALISGQPYTIVTRHSYSGEPISMATRYVYEHFQDLGLDVSFHEFDILGHPSRNVVAERRGLRRPDEIYLITAHLDDMPPGSTAPGADDNASGSTAVLIAADLLTPLDLDCTLRFVLFTGEEQGLIGSGDYAASLAAAGEDVRGVLNLDMIAYNSDAAPILDLYTRSAVPGSFEIAQTFSQVVTVYNLSLTPEIFVDAWLGNYSDNKSFWDHGYPAILAIEDDDDFTPYYHTVGDTLATLDLDYFTEFVRASVGTIAYLGDPTPTGWLAGTVTALETHAPLSATVTALAADRVYSTTTASAGRYSLTLPVYTLTLQVRDAWGDYLPTTVTGIVPVTNTVTVQNFILKPVYCRLFVPLTLKQSAGNP